MINIMSDRNAKAHSPAFKYGGSFLLACAVVLACYLFATTKHASKIEVDAAAYVVAVLPPLLSHFTADNFLKYIAEKDRTSINRAGLDYFVSDVSGTYGLYKSFQNLDCADRHQTDAAKVPLVQCVAEVQFDKAIAFVQATVRQAGNAWSLVKLEVRRGAHDVASPDITVPQPPSTP